MPALVHQRAGRLHRTFHNAIQCDPLLLKVDFSGGNAGDFQQIINESGQLPHLTFNDRTGLLLEFVFVLLETQELHGIGDGRKRIAEFVTQHCQELVLAAMQIRQCQRLAPASVFPGGCVR